MEVEGMHTMEEDLNLEMQMNEMQLEPAEYNEIRVALNDPLRHMMTTTVCFDNHEQLFWAGSQWGHITSYYGPQFMKYTAFQAHHSEVRKILPDAHGVLSLCPDEVRYTTKQGLKIFSAGMESMQSMRSMVRGNGFNDNNVLLAGQNEHFFELDLTSGYVSEKPEVTCHPNTVVMKQSSHYLCCGQQTGQIVLHDPQTLESCHTLEGHSGSLSDFDFNGNLLVTSGFSLSRYGHMNVDPYLMVYDLRSLRAFPPVQVPIEPYFVRFMPTYTVRCLVMSLTGQFLLCQPDSLVVDNRIYQLNNQGAHVMDLCVSENYQCLGVGDEAGYIHLWASASEDQLSFNNQNQETIFADEVPMLDAFAIDDWSIPLTSIPMPECSEPLFSDWPEHLLKRADRPTPPIDQDILKSMTIRQFVGYAPNPKKRLRNQVAYTHYDQTSDKPESRMNRDQGNSIIPEMYRKMDIKYPKYGVDKFNFWDYNKTPFSGLEIHIPHAYCNSMLQVLYFLDVLRVKVSNHLCQEEFCLTCELGFLFHMLEIADDQTCQATNFLRTFRTLPEASALGLLKNESSHRHTSMVQIIQNWNRFVLRQLHQDTSQEPKKKNKNKNEQTDNEKAAATSLKPPSSPGKKTDGDNGDEKPHEQQVVTDEKEEKSDKEDTTKDPTSNFEEPSAVKSIFGLDILTCITCKCGEIEERKSTIFSIDLVYPEIKEEDSEPVQFGELLKNSIIREERNSTWCKKCKKYQNRHQIRKVVSVPDVLNINCQLDRDVNKQFWKKQQEYVHPKLTTTKSLQSSPPKICRYGKFCNRPECKFVHPGREGEQKLSSSDTDGGLGASLLSWLPMYIKAKHNTETNDLEVSDHKPDEETEEDEVVYRLASNVCNIQDSPFATFIAHILVPQKYHEMKGSTNFGQWYVFNDFAINPLSEVDVATFNLDWKVPCVLFYSRVDMDKIYTDEVIPQISSSILFAEKSLAVKQSRFSRNFTPLNSSEILKEGDLVGVDAEFVTLNQEESEMKIDGTVSTYRPSQMSVARITVVRGWGPLEGVPFIDDYISTSEQVVDYLTKFSGIKPGDLDATSSSKHLTTLKTSYQKLRYLTDSNVIFVGHGLKKDFRVINLVIPRDHVVDTVELFHLPNQRLVSLKFLAWHFLNIKIQADTHDSAEDAYTALKLYSKYRELLRNGEMVLEVELEILYETGRQYNWQVPE